MGRLEANPPTQSSDGYPNHHDNPLSSPHEDAVNYTADNSNIRSYVPEKMPQPEAYPPPQPVQYPPQPQPVQYPPQQQPQPQPVQYPPQPQPQPVQFPPQQTTQSYDYAHSNAQPYQTPPVSAQGIAVGSQYLAPTQEWSKTNGLFDCAEDPENAIITACFPCITFGQIAEVVDNGQTSCTTSGLLYCLIASFIGIPCIMSCGYRTKIRNRYGLMETPAPDWVTHFFCEWCALCQEYRELKARGLDPAIGWQGNMMRNQQMQQYTTMTPPTNQTMM
ncbi:putative PLAC8 motif-containing protein [Helianthus annuus]|nr:putative PLAC8 motif-containing protein [Helianthus annuus]KAJ0633065.1 putative PLAC8 motif-containing protein [Helianthus annuus]KAJ0827098.1 putative PLAC8 motif-containing protein [Helianthus annuus]